MFLKDLQNPAGQLFTISGRLPRAWFCGYVLWLRVRESLPSRLA